MEVITFERDELCTSPRPDGRAGQMGSTPNKVKITFVCLLTGNYSAGATKSTVLACAFSI